MNSAHVAITAALGAFGVWCTAAVVRTVRELAPELLAEGERRPLEELGRKAKERWDRLIDHIADWLQPEPEPVPVPVRGEPEPRRR